MYLYQELEHGELSDSSEMFHYGVKGMRWGVRRSQRELDRAAGRTPPKGRGRGEAIRNARRDSADTYSARSKAAKKRNQKAQVVREVVKKGAGVTNDGDLQKEPTAEQKAKLSDVHNSPEYKKAQADFKRAEREYQKAREAHRDNPARAAATRATYGEAAAALALLLPPFGVVSPAVAVIAAPIVGRTIGRNQRERENRQ